MTEPSPSADSKVLHLGAVVGVALAQGMIGAFAKWVPWEPLAIVCGRCVVASCALWAWLLLRRAASVSWWDSRTWWGMVSGGVMLTGHWGTLFWAYRIGDVGPVLVALFTFPIIVSLVEPLVFGTRHLPRQLGSAVLGALGVGLVGWQGSEAAELEFSLLSIALGLLSGALFAVRGILNRLFVTQTGAATIMAFQTTVVAVLLSPALFVMEAEQWQFGPVGLVLLLGLVFTALTHSLSVWALRGISFATASIVGSLQVVSGIFVATVFLGEMLRWPIAVGAALVVSAVLVESLSARRPPSRRRSTPAV